MIDLTFFRVHEGILAGWEQTYAPLNVRGELDKMREWLTANPKRRKKKKTAGTDICRSQGVMLGMAVSGHALQAER